MPLKEGSSDETIRHNIEGILDKRYGYDPPYKDPAREEYTPAQAAAIAYAKAGRRNNTGKKTSSSKKTKGPETDTKKSSSDIQVPEGWKVKEPKGENNTSKKNQSPKKKEEDKPSPEEDKKMLDEVMEGYKLKWGNSATLIEDYWNNLTAKEKKTYLTQAKKFKTEEQDKQTKEDNKTKTQSASKLQTPEGWKQKDDGRTSHLKPKFDDNGNITYQNKVYKPTKTLPGSTNPKLYSDEQGTPKFVVKEGGAKGQNDAEYAANQVYAILSSHLPTGAIKSRLIDGKLVNDFMPNSKTVNDLSDDEFNDSEVLSKVKGSLVADALVANWDYMGLSNDNMMVDDKSRVLRIDSGGTFNYRAQGGPKDFDAVPMEMWTLRSSTQGKQLWGNAQEEDYEDLWTRQVAYVDLEGDALKKAIETSKLPSEIKEAFNKRVDILSIASEEINNIANRDGVSWKGVDQVMERAFRYSSMMNSKSPDWADKVRNKIRNDLEKAFPEQAPKLDFDLPSDKTKFNKDKFKKTVLAVDTQLNSSYAGDLGGDVEALKQISPEGKYALRQYSGTLYQDLNKFIRGKTQSFLPSDIKFFNQVADVMDESLNQIPDHPNVGMFYRMNKISNKYTDDIDALNNLKPGDIYVSKGYSSYTDEHEDDERNRNEVLDSFYHGSTSKTNFITIYQGKNIKNIAPMSDIQEERESLMQRDKKLKVASIKEESIKDWKGISWGGNETATGKIKVIYLTDED